MPNSHRSLLPHPRSIRRTHLFLRPPRRVASGLLLTLVLTGNPTAPTLAQGSDANVAGNVAIEEIIVTARRRAERIQDTPISITAFSADTLQELNIRDLSDTADFAPNVTFIEGGNGVSGGIVYIRGIGPAGVEDPRFSPAVGIYLDGVYLPRSWGSLRDLVDLERVEILRGPQGTLFGKNTTGGAYHLTSRKPGDEFGGRAEVTVGNFDRLEAKFRLDIPVSETLLTSVTAFSHDRDGYTESLWNGTEQQDIDRAGVRAAMRWLPTENITVDLSADYLRWDEAGEGRRLHFIWPDAWGVTVYNRALEFAGLPLIDDSFIPDSFWDNYSNEPQKSEGEDYGVRLGIEYDFGPATLTSITAYRELPHESAHDHDGQPTQFWHQDYKKQEHDQFSQEVQLSGMLFDDRLNWVAGVYYYTDETDLEHHQVLFGELFPLLEQMPLYSGGGLAGFPDELCFVVPNPPCVGGAGNPVNFAFFFRQNDLNSSGTESESWAGFMHGTFELADRWSISAGVRYTWDEATDHVFQTRDWTTGELIDPADCPIRPQDCVFGSRKADWSAWTPKFGIEYQASEDALIYASASRGFKAGGHNNLFPPAWQPSPEFDPEFVWTYELGFKSQWLDDRLRLNAALFYNDYEDFQTTVSTIDPVAGPVSVRLNASDVEIKGGELEFIIQPVPRFSVSGGIGYLDEDFTAIDLGLGDVEVTEDTEIPYTPDWNANAQVRYEIPLSAFGTLTLFGSAVYTDKQYMNLGNDEENSQDAYTLFNGRISLAPNSGQWELALFGTNLSDREVITYAFGGSGPFGNSPISAAPPRMWGGSFTYNF